MLALDAASSQPQLSDCVNATLPVTANALGLKYLVKPFSDKISDSSIKQVLAIAQTNAAVWPNELCDTFSQSAPNLVIGFAPVFLQSLSALQADVSALELDASDSRAKADLVTGLGRLLDTLKSLNDQAAAMTPRLQAYSRTIQNDHTSVLGALNTLAHSLAGGATIVQQLNGVLATSFYQTQQLSPCIAILSLTESITLQLTQIGGNAPSLVPMAMCQALLNGLSLANEKASTSLSAILDSWAVLTLKYQAVIDSLKAATEQDLPALLISLDLDVAAKAWEQLNDFAHSLIQPR